MLQPNHYSVFKSSWEQWIYTFRVVWSVMLKIIFSDTFICYSLLCLSYLFSILWYIYAFEFSIRGTFNFFGQKLGFCCDKVIWNLSSILWIRTFSSNHRLSWNPLKKTKIIWKQNSLHHAFWCQTKRLLAPQSGALRITPLRDFHPIPIPSQSHPIHL